MNCPTPAIPIPAFAVPKAAPIVVKIICRQLNTAAISRRTALATPAKLGSAHPLSAKNIPEEWGPWRAGVVHGVDGDGQDGRRW